MASTGSPSSVIPNRRILNKHFINQIVSEPVKEFSISAGSKAGDGVMGKLLSVDVKTVSNEIHNLILKSVLPMTGLIDKNTLIDGQFMVGLHAFPLEICFYKEIIPIFQEAAKEHPRLNVFSRPKYYSSHCDKENGLNDYMALEDLRPSGYKMMDKYKGLNLEQMEAVLKQLAIFHAVSYCLLNGKTANKQFCEIRNDPKHYFNTHGWDKRTHPIADHELFYNGLITGMTDIVRRDMGMVEVAQRIEDKFAKTGYQIMIDLWEKTGKEDKYFPVLIHGDLWTNNILYKLAPDGRSVEDVKFIDFQMIRFGNIYEELHYFIFTSTTPEFRKENLQPSLKLYYDEFVKVVEELGGCPLPKGFTFKELVTTFNENLNYGTSYNLITIPFQLGVSPPPPSPMTPIELELKEDSPKGNGNKFFPDGEEQETDFNKIEMDMIVGLIESVRNSQVAQEWFKQLLEEMVEYDVI